MDIIDTNTAESRRRRALDTIDDRFIGTTNLNTSFSIGYRQNAHSSETLLSGDVALRFNFL